MLRLSAYFALLFAAFAPAWAAAFEARAVMITAADGVALYGIYLAPPRPRALILLFHQADASSDEYEAVAPRLAAQGFATLAIDSRSGGRRYGRNLTVESLGGASRPYLEARRDIDAALAWALRRPWPIVLMGSSYSSSLVLMAAADRPSTVAAVLSFSPGEYFGQVDVVRQAAGRVQAPVLVYAAPTDEFKRAQPIFAAIPTAQKLLLTPRAGLHGAASLDPARNGAGADQLWRPLAAWLDARFPPDRPAIAVASVAGKDGS